MQQGIDKKEAVRLAKEKLGEATAQELAVYIREAFGLVILPAFVTVLLGTMQERETLNLSGQAALEQLARWKAENPLEARKLSAAVKRREAVKRRKAEAAGAKESEVAGPEPVVPLDAGSGGEPLMGFQGP
jgi:hypothetical protein